MYMTDDARYTYVSDLNNRMLVFMQVLYILLPDWKKTDQSFK